MTRGTVKWFNNPKGFGFIKAEGVDGDIFVHYSEIVMDGFKTIAAGQTVQLEIVKSNKGAQAKDVVVIEQP